MVLPILCLAGVSFIISFVLTLAMKHIAPRINFVDKPGNRKIHLNAKPLGGGVAIFWGTVLPLLVILLGAELGFFDRSGVAAYIGGIRRQTPLAVAILFAVFLMHLIGLWDDKKALGPFIKLILQLIITAALVIFFDLRLLTALGPIPSIILSILWITAVTNAFNFLDNMDGLSAGIAVICSIAFLITTLSISQWFIASGLSLLIGALLGFLCFNFSPATIFMGDSGSLVIGFLLGVLTIRTTFLPMGVNIAAGWYALFAPVIVLALPMYDLVLVVFIRLARGKSPFVGDTNHFSHRLVARGMSRRTAVLCLYLVTAATSIAAILLTHVQSASGALLIFIQTLLILGVVALLERHPLPSADA
ncbi:MAG TPA: MraY family glycosyltransferase [Tepidisphaeraceae bacterium]|jgi:UDP-GlcNAc:undecaprenyl-phosphate GlcNAc-1-phosphate transferase